MKAIVISELGGPDVLHVSDVDEPKLETGEVLIKVCAAGINRADALQREGHHPPPEGDPPYPGLECSGVIEAVTDGVTKWKVGDEVNKA